MRKLLIAFIVVAATFVAADRIAVAVAENQVSNRVAAAYGLPVKPRVTIGGFPFLTQVLTGDYQQIDVTASAVPAGGATLTRLHAQLRGVHASLSQVLGHGAVTVTAADASGTAVVGYRSVDQQLPAGVTVSPHGKNLNVSDTALHRGRSTQVSAPATLSVTGAGIRVAAGGQGAGHRRMTVVIPLQTLPLHLRVRSVDVTPGGLRIGASAHDVHFARS